MRIDLELIVKAYRGRKIGRRWPHEAVAWDRLWTDISRRYHEGKLSDAEYDSLLSMMP